MLDQLDFASPLQSLEGLLRGKVAQEMPPLVLARLMARTLLEQFLQVPHREVLLDVLHKQAALKVPTKQALA